MSTAESAMASCLEADAFLRLLAGGSPVTFQTFTDAKPPPKPDPLARWLHGTLAEHASTLGNLNARGAGVFWMVNAGDGKGRASANVQQVRALFVDLDGAPLEPITLSSLPAHCVVESSPGRWHAYWLVTDCPTDRFRTLQKALAVRFNADPRVHDLARVMRVPGFDHRKSKAYRTRIVAMHEGAPYTMANLVEAFDLSAPAALEPAPRADMGQLRTRQPPDAIPEGERNSTLFRLACGLVQQGYDERGVNGRLQKINRQRCLPQLSTSEVNAIAASATRYGVRGIVPLTRALCASSAWKGLQPAEQVIALEAVQHYNGSNNDNISLPWTDFKGRPGFGKEATFYQRRARVVASGILVIVQPGGMSQHGRMPDLFAIAKEFLPPALTIQRGCQRRLPKETVLIDKQPCVGT